jgi:uncharacterized protein (TIGR03663 family)
MKLVPVISRYAVVALLAAVALALILRLPLLSHRPYHNDEAVNGYKFAQLWQTGSYKYDPNEHHGPALYFGSYALAKLTASPPIEQFTDGRLRLLTVIFGVGLIGLLFLTVDGLGVRPTRWAAVFTAISPAMVYYSRYYIHEMLLVFFTYLALAAGWRYWRDRRPGWAILAGAAIGLMDATKETFVITLIAVAIALACNQVWNRWFDASGPPLNAQPIKYSHLLLGLAAWLAVMIVLFSSFFTNASGPLDSLRTYIPWLNRAGGDSPHIHPWYFYLRRLLFFHVGKGPWWTEGLILFLAVIGGSAGFMRRRLGRANPSFIRFLALYTFAVACGYSLIAYKTPWCLLNFHHGLILLAGVGAVVLLRSIRLKPARISVFVVLLVGCGHLLWQTWAANVPYAADQRNPYVYAHTSPDLTRLVDRLYAITAASPQGTNTLIKVMAPEDDFWPLPWYLRGYKQVGWWGELQPDPYAPLMLVSSTFHAGLDEKGTHLMVGYFQLRPQVFFELYVEKQLWIAYLAKNPPPRPAEDEE